MKRFYSRIPLPLANQRGVSLVEVIAVMVIIVITIVIAAGGISVFFRKYKELQAYAELQADALEVLNYIKNGIPVGSQEIRRANNGELQFIKPKEFFGVNNAITIRFLSAPYGASQANGIRVVPIETESIIAPSDFADFYLYDGTIRCNWRYRGIAQASPVTLFPKIGKRDYMFLDQITFRRINSDTAIWALEVSLKARVQVGPKQFKSVHYRTKMVKK
jgi:prepilin-type N-terminal cleavage/methylation domain-containing protein